MSGYEDRSRLIGSAVNSWVDQLTDLTARNNLLYYKDLKRGTLDLSGTSPGARERLLAGREVRSSALFPDEGGRADAVTRLKEIHRKSRELDEERGISAGYVVAGVATWRERDRQPAAPVLLRPLIIRAANAARDEFELRLDTDCELNPVLLFKIRNDFGVTVAPESVEEAAEVDPGDPRAAYEELSRLLAGRVPGFAISDRLIAGTFTYAKLPMVTDLRDSAELLCGNDIVAAIAGSPVPAPPALDGSGPGPAEPHREFLILDADSSQQAVVNAVAKGASLVVQGPPGTGKSQTIANLITCMIAAGKRVLFVAEKRAAIDAVLTRLERRDLTSLVLDIHDGVKSKRKVAADLKRALDTVGSVRAPEPGDLYHRLGYCASRLDSHDALLNELREPWRVTLFDIRAELVAIPEDLRSPVRVRGEALARLAGEAAGRARDDLRDHARLAGLIGARATPWVTARISTPSDADWASQRARALDAALLPRAQAGIRQICAGLGIPEPGSLAQGRELFTLLAGVADSRALLGEDAFGPELPDMVTATASRQVRKARGGGPSWLARRKLRALARARWTGSKPGTAELRQALAAAEDQAGAWKRAGCRGAPGLPECWPSASEAFTGFAAVVDELDGCLGRGQLAELTLPELARVAARLSADADVTWDMATMAGLAGGLRTAGLGDLVADVTRRHISPEDAVIAFDSMWYGSIIDHIRISDPRYGADSGTDLSGFEEEFVRHDVDHLARNADRVRRRAAELARDAQDAHPEQARVLRREAAKQRRHRPLRDLITEAPDVLLALKPCWATSPIVVSQKLPPARLFDVVVFDEASQVKQADAIPAIMRARQVVVAGDSKQLPPTDFFAGTEDDDDDDGDAGTAALTGGAYESILTTLEPVLPRRQLMWHYRSRDERLIGFSNQHFYEPKMITFPGIGGDRCLSHVVAGQHLGVAGQDQSVTAEVERVVELILHHASTRPGESLGVITLGLRHMHRIQAKLDAELKGRGDLEAFFAEERDDAFFLKNLERVQGDERDAIIVTIGYGKAPDGRMLYRWGPVLRAGGERRLNVAVSRARVRLTLVSSFSSDEVNPDRVRGEGGKLLCAYLRYAGSGGADPGQRTGKDVPLNPFERDVRDRLQDAGIPVIPQYGSGGYRIDFAAQHPEFPGRMVLAIEADGASYHSAHGARERDRLRQQHLEKQGWRFHRIWSADWFADPAAEIRKVRAAYEQAVARSGRQPGGTAQSLAVPGGAVPGGAVPGPAAAAPADEPPSRRLRRPPVEPGYPVDRYDIQDLAGLARWIASDGLLRTEEELVRIMMGELGFRNLGRRIDARLREAIRRAR